MILILPTSCTQYIIACRYVQEFAKSELLSRKLAYQCAKKITHLVLETDAFMSSTNNQVSAFFVYFFL